MSKRPDKPTSNPLPDEPILASASPVAIEAAQRFLQTRNTLQKLGTSAESRRTLTQLLTDGETAATELLRMNSVQREIFEEMRKAALKKIAEGN